MDLDFFDDKNVIVIRIKRTEYKNNRKHVICSSLSEFFEEFKKYRTSKSNIAKKENYNEHVFPYSPIDKNVIDGKEPPKLFLVDLDYWDIFVLEKAKE